MHMGSPAASRFDDFLSIQQSPGGVPGGVLVRLGRAGVASVVVVVERGLVRLLDIGARSLEIIIKCGPAHRATLRCHWDAAAAKAPSDPETD